MANLKTEKNIPADEEISELRQAVLKWVELKKEEPKIGAKKTKSKTVISEIKTPPLIVKQHKKSSKGSITKKGIGAKIVFFSIIVCFLFLVGFGAYLYYFKPLNLQTEFITKIIPYPVALVNFQPISYFDWQNQVVMMQNFYAKQKNSNPSLAAPTGNEIESNILNKLIDQKLTAQLAKKYSLSVSPREISQQTEILSEQIGSRQSLQDQLMNLYNWTLIDFSKAIIEPMLLKNKLAMAIMADDQLNLEARQKAQAVLDKVKNNGADFSDLAKQYSEDITSLQGGDMGYFSRGQMTPEFENAAFALNVGEVSGIIKSQFGYHIIKVEEKLADEAGQTTQIRARQILIRGHDLATYLAQLKTNSNIWQLIKI